MRLNGPFCDHEATGYGGVRQTFGDQSQYLTLSLGQPVQRILPPVATHEASDDRRINNRLVVSDSTQGVDQDGYIKDSLLEQVTDPSRVLLQQLQRIRRLDVLGEDQHPNPRVL